MSLRSIATFQGAVPPSPSRVPSGFASGFPHLHALRSLPDRGYPSRASPLTATPPSSGDDGLFEPGPGITPPAETPPLPMLAPPNPEGLRQRTRSFLFQSRRDAFEGKISVVSLRFSGSNRLWTKLMPVPMAKDLGHKLRIRPILTKLGYIPRCSCMLAIRKPCYKSTRTGFRLRANRVLPRTWSRLSPL